MEKGLKMKIRAILTLEMIGRPPEHMEETMKGIIERIGNIVEVTEKTLHKPKALKDTENLFSSFAEIEIETESLLKFFGVIFTYLPSHVEVITPEELKMRNSDINEIANDIVKRLHQYDEIVKRIAIERQILEKQLKERGIEPASLPASGGGEGGGERKSRGEGKEKAREGKERDLER